MKVYALLCLLFCLVSHSFGLLYDGSQQISMNSTLLSSDLIYVDDDAPHDPGPNNIFISDPLENGTIDHPYDSIQEAIDAAAIGCQVVLNTGVYVENTIIDEKELTLTSLNPNDPIIVASTIIKGNDIDSILTMINSNCIIEGFSIRDGFAENGGAIYSENSNLTLSKLEIINNKTINGIDGVIGEPGETGGSSGHGGGIYCTSSVIKIMDSIIAQNSTGRGGNGGDGNPYEGGMGGYSGWGAGIYAIDSELEVTNCDISSNSTGQGGSGGDGDGYGGIGGGSGSGGGISSINSILELSDCFLSDNSTGHGGDAGEGGYTFGGASGNGGALHCDGGSLALERCSVTSNSSGDGGNAFYYAGNIAGSSGNGGGVCCEGTHIVAFRQCQVVNNRIGSGGTAAWPGGSGGYTGNGGGVYISVSTSIRVDLCSFSYNEMGMPGGGEFGGDGGDGGGLYCSSQASVDLTECNFLNNQAGNASQGGSYGGEGGCGGGAVIISPDSCITTCTFLDNTAGDGEEFFYGGDGGALYCSEGLVATNCLITNNNTGGGMYTQSCGYGGGIYVGSSLSMVNCTIANNTAVVGTYPEQNGKGGGIYCVSSADIKNSILWNNYAGGAADETTQFDGGMPNFVYSCIHGFSEGSGATHNIGNDPLFDDPNSRDFHLLSNSPCIDGGLNSVVTETTDLEGNPRIIDGDRDGPDIVDMGAYEFADIESMVFFVDDNAVGLNQGTNWENAFICLHDALLAATYGDEIKIARGLYIPDNEPSIQASFHLVNGVVLKGGYAGVNGTDPDARDIMNYETILSGDRAMNDIELHYPIGDNSYITDNCNHVIISNKTDEHTVVDGFTIIGGYARSSRGGGLFSIDSSTVIKNCTFKYNIAEYDGGGICNYGENLFEDQILLKLENCIFRGNMALLGIGGGMVNVAAQTQLRGCQFMHNAADWAAGIGLEHASIELINCMLTNNFCPADSEVIGGNNICVLKNCTISDNSGGVSIAYGSLIITNSIIWNNSGFQINVDDEFPPEINVAYSDIHEGWPGIGNINANPRFTDPVNGDFHLQSTAGRWDRNSLSWGNDLVTSPCIDAGDPEGPAWTNELWPHGMRVNMGAYGGTAEASKSPAESGNIADIVSDGCVQIQDLIALIEQWLTPQILSPEDLNGDNQINLSDFAVFAQNWGLCYEMGLVGHWAFSGTEGTVAFDASGYKNHGTLVNGPAWTGSGQLSFDGIDDYVEVADSTYLRFANHITLSAWVKLLEDSDRFMKIIVKPSSTQLVDPWENFCLDLRRKNPRFVLSEGVAGTWTGAYDATWGSPIEVGSWVHVAGTYDGQTMRLYVNGQLMQTTPVALTIGSTELPVYIGGRGDADSFTGQVDDIRLYNRALSDAEIQALFYER